MSDQLHPPIFIIRLLVGWVFLLEGILKFLRPEELGGSRFSAIGIPAPHLMAPFVGGGDCLRLLCDRRISYEIGSNPSADRYLGGDALNQDSHLAWSWLLAFHSAAAQTLRSIEHVARGTHRHLDVPGLDFLADHRGRAQLRLVLMLPEGAP